MRLSAVISATMLPGAVEVADADRVLLGIEIFLAPGSGAASQISKPEYMPHRPDSVAASAARIRKPARPELCRKNGIDVGRVDEEIGAEELGDVGGRELGQIVGQLLLACCAR